MTDVTEAPEVGGVDETMSKADNGMILRILQQVWRRMSD